MSEDQLDAHEQIDGFFALDPLLMHPAQLRAYIKLQWRIEMRSPFDNKYPSSIGFQGKDIAAMDKTELIEVVEHIKKHGINPRMK
jgi:hypothetical protein